MPRECGEHAKELSYEKALLGSSPLARGTRVQKTWPYCWLRLIPARAGNTALAMVRRLMNPAHPHSHREHRLHSMIFGPSGGSSPLARGTRRCAPGVLVYHGLIPARAGNNSRANPSPKHGPVHPRSGGEHPTSGVLSAGHPGSSPLAQGILDNLHTTCGQPRLIPARAGNMPDSPPQHQETQAHPHSRGDH